VSFQTVIPCDCLLGGAGVLLLVLGEGAAQSFCHSARPEVGSGAEARKRKRRRRGRREGEGRGEALMGRLRRRCCCGMV